MRTSEVNGRLWTLEGAREFVKGEKNMRLTAAEARSMSYAYKINKIYSMIKDAAEQGDYSIYVDITNENIIKQLKEDGYNVAEMSYKDKYRVAW